MERVALRSANTDSMGGRRVGVRPVGLTRSPSPPSPMARHPDPGAAIFPVVAPLPNLVTYLEGTPPSAAGECPKWTMGECCFFFSWLTDQTRFVCNPSHQNLTVWGRVLCLILPGGQRDFP